MIPRKLHRVWLGTAPIPPEYEGFWRRWGELHPDWDLKTWRDADLGWLRNRDLFEKLATVSGQSDVVRFELLAEQGGVYVDADMEPLRPLDPLLCFEAFAAWEDHLRICTATMGAEPKHPGARKLIEELPDWVKKHPDSEPDIQTGPGYLTKVWGGRHDVAILPSRAFYPVSYWDRFDLGGPYPPESFAVHHWGRSWMDAEKRARDDQWAIRERAKVSVLVPWRSDDGPREEVWRWLKARWEKHLPKAEIVLGNNRGHFARAAAINSAARKATGDIFVIADADSWVDIRAVRTAVQEVEDYLIPWDKGYKLDRAFTRSILRQDPLKVKLARAIVTRHLDEPEHHHLSGMIVTTREAFEKVGGFDARFKGWGFEDTAFVYALQQVFGPRGRLPFNLIHLWHPPASDQDNPSEESVTTFNEYRANMGLPPWRRGIDR